MSSANAFPEYFISAQTHSIMSASLFSIRLSLLSASLLFGQILLTPVSAGVTPATNVEQGLERAQKAKKDCLIFAYGDWDAYSNDIYKACWKSTSALGKELENSTVVAEVNFPQNPKESEEKSFKKKANGYPGSPPCLPSVAFVDANGFHYATVSGTALGGEEKQFALALGEVQKKRIQRDEILKQAKLKKGVERAKMIGSAGDIPGIRTDTKTLLALVKECDPSDMSGYIRRLSFDVFKLQDDLTGEELKKRLEMLDEIINDEGYAIEQRQMVLGLRAGELNRAGGDNEKAIQETYKKMYQLDPNSIFGRAGRRGLQETFSTTPLVDLVSKPEEEALAELNKVYNDKGFPYSNAQRQEMLDIRVRILSGARSKENKDAILATYKEMIELDPNSNWAEFAQQEIDFIINPNKRKDGDRMTREQATQPNVPYGEEIYPDDE